MGLKKGYRYKGDLTCPQCGRHFRSRQALINHEKAHTTRATALSIQNYESGCGTKTQKVVSNGSVNSFRTTDVLSEATIIRFVPKVVTCAYTPIMRAAVATSVNVFGWPKAMPFEDFLDTVIFRYFRDHGVTLGSESIQRRMIYDR